MTSPLRDSLFIAMQRLLPARLLARLVYRATRSRNRMLKVGLISGFARLYGVEVAEAERPVPSGYDSFNDFFTRALRPGARPLDTDPATIVSRPGARLPAWRVSQTSRGRRSHRMRRNRG